jgi:hypothetical protein
MLDQRGAGPLPNAAHISLATELVSICGDCNRVPMLETYIRTLKVGEELLRALPII